MRRIRIRHVDAFTDRTFGGNPAGVVPIAQGLTDQEMQSIANEMNLSETAFILPSDKADFRIRWFTPKREIQFCGHATIASLHVLAEDVKYGMNKDGVFSFKIETMVGILNVDIEKKGSSIRVILQSPPIDLVKEELDKKELSDALRIEETAIENVYPIMRERTLDYLYVALTRLETLKQVSYDFVKLENLGKKHDIKGFTVLTKETFEKSSNVHSRFFTPYYGIREDPTTGSSHGPLGVYLVMNGIAKLDANNQVLIKAEQGDIMGRPGRMTVKVTRQKDGTYNAKLVSQAVTVLDGELILP
jgi:trans-2,3-dihydro-3-hydroxyanthranilate isomerase